MLENQRDMFEIIKDISGYADFQEHLDRPPTQAN